MLMIELVIEPVLNDIIALFYHVTRWHIVSVHPRVEENDFVRVAYQQIQSMSAITI